MTTTACDDQFVSNTETHIAMYSIEEILRRNVADMEKELQRQRERAEAAESELKSAREQEPVAFWWIGPDGKDNGGPYRGKPSDAAIDNARNMGCEPQLLFAGPVSAPAVTEEWRAILQWLINQRGKAGHCHARPGIWDDDNGDKAGLPCEQCAMYDRARALVQSAQPVVNPDRLPNCRTCANRGQVNGLSQESFCESCVYQGRDWRKNHYMPVNVLKQEMQSVEVKK